MSAVGRFQTWKGIEATGIVGPATWKAMSPLLMKDQPVPKYDHEGAVLFWIPAPEPAAGVVRPVIEFTGARPFDVIGELLLNFMIEGRVLAEPDVQAAIDLRC